MSEGLSPAEVGKEIAEHQHRPPRGRGDRSRPRHHHHRGHPPGRRGRAGRLVRLRVGQVEHRVVAHAGPGLGGADRGQPGPIPRRSDPATSIARRSTPGSPPTSPATSPRWTSPSGASGPSSRWPSTRGWRPTPPPTPTRPPGPTYMPEYKQPEQDEANELDAKADAKYAEGAAAADPPTLRAHHRVPGQRAVPRRHQRSLPCPRRALRPDRHRHHDHAPRRLAAAGGAETTRLMTRRAGGITSSGGPGSGGGPSLRPTSTRRRCWRSGHEERVAPARSG